MREYAVLHIIYSYYLPEQDVQLYLKSLNLFREYTVYRIILLPKY